MGSIHVQTEIPGPRSRALFAERTRQVARGPFHTTPIVVARAAGAVLEDVDGNRFLDFASGIAVTNLGHCPDAVVGAIREQSRRFLHTSINVVSYEGYIDLARALNELAPISSPCKTLLVNTGAEAVENAVKIARTHTRRPAVVCFDHAFHGRTYMAMALTSKALPYKSGFAPFPAEVYRAPFPDLYRSPGVGSEAVACGGNLPCAARPCVCAETWTRFRHWAHTEIGEENIAAVILEPVTGEGGFQPVPAPFLRALRRWCQEHGAVLILDEIQTGFGRTGTMFACEQSGVEPDLLVMAKGLGGGLPIAAVTGRAEVMDAVGPGGLGGTYAGNPLACAAALAVIAEMRREGFREHTGKMTSLIKDFMESYRSKFSFVGDVRGLGPMQAMELVQDRATKEPAPALLKDLVRLNYESGLITLGCGSHANVLRLLPPLNIRLDQLREGLEVLEGNLARLV